MNRVLAKAPKCLVIFASSWDDKMYISVEQERLIIRISPDNYDEVLQKEGCRPSACADKIMNSFCAC